jgi:hypothetical protein
MVRAVKKNGVNVDVVSAAQRFEQLVCVAAEESGYEFRAVRDVRRCLSNTQADHQDGPVALLKEQRGDKS